MFPHFPSSHHMLHPYHSVSPDTPSDFRAFYPYTPNEVKHRKRTTSTQLRTLESVFKRDTKPNATLRNQLAEQLKMTPRGVQVWFQNRRAKEKSKANKAKTATEANKQQDSPLATTPPGLRDSSTPSPLPDDTESQPSFDHEQPQELAINAQPTDSITPPIITPPQIFTNSGPSGWDQQQQAVLTNDDNGIATNQLNTLSATELYATRRGSLPVHMFPHQPINPIPSDPFMALHRRASVDANMHHITNPYAMLPRVRTDGVTGIRGQRTLAGRSPPLLRSSQSYSQGRTLGLHTQYSGMRRASMDSRVMLLSQRGNLSPSQSLTAYNGARASLPLPNLFTIPSRTISPPGPGPLPAPNFQFGAASPGEGDGNSPDSPSSLTYRDDERDDDNTSVGSYIPHSRFGSFQSIATSESGSLYSDFTTISSAMPSPAMMNARRHSCTPAFVGLMSTLGVTDSSLPESIIENDYHHDVASSEFTDINPMFNYRQPVSADCTQDSLSPSSFAFSQTSELAHALENQPQLAESSKLDDHMMCNSHASHLSSVDGGVSQADGGYYVPQNEAGLSDISIPDYTSTLPEQSFSMPFAHNYLSGKNTDGLQTPVDYTQCLPSPNIYSNYGDSPFSSSVFRSTCSSPRPTENSALYS
ncbi:hypothetical protein APHAL10511_004820 [Amanita phalloides]|nr:hypothetical protein APHAL10511_004820 [Amanita phalloides]